VYLPGCRPVVTSVAAMPFDCILQKTAHLDKSMSIRGGNHGGSDHNT
jgi:hypothetical protein